MRTSPHDRKQLPSEEVDQDDIRCYQCIRGTLEIKKAQDPVLETEPFT
jgi:hypothetical protein